MTIKEIAEAVGKGESSVRRWVVKASATMADLISVSTLEGEV